MIPLKDYNPTTRVPVVTLVLIAANIFVYFAIQHGQTELIQPSDPRVKQQQEIEQLRFTYQYAAVPDEVVHDEPLTTAEIAQSLHATPGEVAVVICERPEAGPNSECFPHKN